MTQNKRIFLNVVATYGRSLYSMAIGLFCGRWMLMVLGDVDYGLLGVVGGMVTFLTFVNSVLASSISRFYAYSVGLERVDADSGIDECQRWFNLALLLHLVVPFLIVVIGYPTGIWAIENHLTIPADRITSCIWIWRFVMVSSFITMASVPFQAMYNAKQEIAELTIYNVATVTIKTIALYWMLTHPGFWLVKYAFISSLLVVAPQLIITIRAFCVYPECRIRPCYFWDARKIKELFKFAGIRFVSTGTMMLGNTGSTLLVNRILGPAKNAAVTIGNLVSSQSVALSSSISGAFSPAITNAAGARDYSLMKKLAYRASAFGTIAVLIFILPLLLEVDEVMHLWLETPPVGAAGLCQCYLCVVVLERISDGHWMSFYAMGRIYRYQICEVLSWVIMLPLVYSLMRMGLDIKSVGLSMIVVKTFTTCAKVYYARKECGLSIRYWLLKIVFPLIGNSTCALAIGYCITRLFNPSFARVCLTTIAINAVFLTFCWAFLLDRDSKNLVRSKLKSFCERLRRHSFL